MVAPGATQNQQQALDAGIDAAWAHIIDNPDCAAFLTSKSTLGSIAAAWGQLAQTLDNTTYLFGQLDDPDTAAQTPEGGNQVTINTSGAFFASPTLGSTVFVTTGPNSPQLGFSSVVTLDAMILLHELGHETGVLPVDTGSASAQNGPNTTTILNNCFTKNAQGLYQ